MAVLAAVLAFCSAAQANQWEHQSSPWQSGGQSIPDPGWALDYPNGMAWVLGPDSTTIRSPVSTPQPTGLTWSIVPGGVADWLDENRTTQPITALNALGLSTFADYQAVLEGVIDEWASVCGITNLGYVEEDGSVLVGGGVDTNSDGIYITDRGLAAGVGHIRFIAYDREALNGASASGQATYIPEPGSGVDNAANHRKAGDVRLRSDAAIFADTEQLNVVGSGDGFYLRKIAMHEVGHVLGFGHNSVSDSVMGGGSITELGLGEGDIEGAIAIYGPIPEPGDMNQDGNITAADSAMFVQALVDPAAYAAHGFPFPADEVGDMNQDGTFDLGDIAVFNALPAFNPASADADAVPEPSTFLLAAFALLGLAYARRKR